MLNLNLTDFHEDQQDVFFVTYNSYNSFLLALEDSSLYYVEDLQARAQSKQDLLVIIFIVTICVLLITSSFLLPMIQNVNKVRINVLSLFVDIPQASVEELADRCEDFIMNLENDHNDEIVSNDGGDLNKEQTALKEEHQDQKPQK